MLEKVLFLLLLVKGYKDNVKHKKPFKKGRRFFFFFRRNNHQIHFFPSERSTFDCGSTVLRCFPRPFLIFSVFLIHFCGHSCASQFVRKNSIFDKNYQLLSLADLTLILLPSRIFSVLRHGEKISVSHSWLEQQSVNNSLSRKWWFCSVSPTSTGERFGQCSPTSSSTEGRAARATVQSLKSCLRGLKKSQAKTSRSSYLTHFPPPSLMAEWCRERDPFCVAAVVIHLCYTRAIRAGFFLPSAEWVLDHTLRSWHLTLGTWHTWVTLIARKKVARKGTIVIHSAFGRAASDVDRNFWQLRWRKLVFFFVAYSGNSS